MEIFKTIGEIQNFLNGKKNKGLTIGFVPTMGALHQGHLSLVERSIEENDHTVCSIFVNPIQFNRKEDLLKYPRDTESDIQKLEESGCNTVFCPEVEEIYPESPTEYYDFGNLDKIMEGAFRPGHFNGVAVVVKRLFEIIKPDRAYFGEKDFQQLAIVQDMVRQLNIPVLIVPCSIVREKDGLAMSSRNQRLTENERKLAPFIYQTLKEAQERAKKSSVDELKNWVLKQFHAHKDFKLEYFEIVDMKTLLQVKTWSESENIIACIAAFLGNIRLIDNIVIIS